MEIDKPLAIYLVWSLEQQGFRAEALDTGVRINGLEIYQIRVWVETEIHLLSNFFHYTRFRSKYIINARREHHQAIRDLIDSVDPTKGFGPYED